jgi:hypothetical protein
MALKIVHGSLLMFAVFLGIGDVRAQSASATELVDALNRVFGQQHHARANHANGLVAFAPAVMPRR